MSTPPPAPHPYADPDSEPYWQGLARGELLVQRCTGCANRRFPARPVCDRCASLDAVWEPVSGLGAVTSWIVTHQRFSPAFADRLPSTVLLVQLDEQADLLVYGNLRPEGPVTAGMPVRAVFEEVDGVAVCNWSRA
jgi:uncharacterized OB-fold protein